MAWPFFYKSLGADYPPRYIIILWAIAALCLLGVLIYNNIALKGMSSLPSFLAINTYSINNSFHNPNPQFITERGLSSQAAINVFIIPSLISESFKFICPAIYWRLVQANHNWVRPLEFAITAPVMMWLIMYDCGITDRFALCQGASSILLMLIVGYWFTGNPHPSWQQHLICFYLLIIPFIQAFIAYGSHSPSPPWQVTVIVVVEFFLYSSYGFVSVFCTYYNEPAPYIITELASVILSISAKTIMACMHIAGEQARS